MIIENANSGVDPSPTRLAALDTLRGLGILGVVFLHFALYNFSGLLAIDFDNPPAIITIIGFFLTWAGLFAVISGTAYGFSAYRRIVQGVHNPAALLRSLLTAGVLLLILHYLYFLLLGPTLLDLEEGSHQYSLLVGLVVTGRADPPSFDRVFYNTSLSMIAWNLIFTGLILFLLLRGGKAARSLRARWHLIGISAVVLLLSIVRLPVFPIVESALERQDPLTMIVTGVLFNKNDPVLPYLGFGLIGTSFGLSIAAGDSRRRIGTVFNSVGVFWTVVGLVGLATLPDTMLERSVDFFWFYLVLFQCGLFTLIIVNAVLLTDLSARHGQLLKATPIRVIAFLGTISLTLFLVESPVSALLARLWASVLPGWDSSIPVLLGLSAVNLAVYGALIVLWRRFGFVGSAEWLVAKLHLRLGRATEKLATIRTYMRND